MGDMKLYFCGSICGGRADLPVYQRIVKKLQTYGTVLTEHVSSSDITEKGEDVIAIGEKAIHDRDVEWLQESDVIVAEVTQPSLGVGYEIGRAVTMKKRILCLFRPSSGRRLSAMIRGAADGQMFVVRDYVEEDLENILEEYFRKLKKP
ncbi:5-hydroxymethyl-dUMP N-hydrolase [Antennarius striatus]|uniref:5-hydroxymethyl-dUMP N-hydrolase n=1 Tax=Antennarius striatus TaxID=241820 RepID=UPI0035B02C8E